MNQWLYRQQQAHQFAALKKSLYTFKGRFKGGGENNFSFFGKIRGMPKFERDSLCRKQPPQSMFWLSEKYPLIPLREKSGGVSGKTFLHLEESPFYPNGRRCVCAGRRWLWKIKSGMKRTQKDPLIPSKEDLGRGVGKIFLWFIKICALPKPTQALLCRRTGPYIADNKTGTSPFVWRCPLSLFNAAQFLRWVYL